MLYDDVLQKQLVAPITQGSLFHSDPILFSQHFLAFPPRHSMEILHLKESCNKAGERIHVYLNIKPKAANQYFRQLFFRILWPLLDGDAFPVIRKDVAPFLQLAFYISLEVFAVLNVDRQNLCNFLS